MESALMTVFRPFQKIMATDRMYRMYAPDPRPAKSLPFLELKTEKSPVRFLKTPPGRGFAPGGVFAKEKWANFVDQIARGLRGETSFFSQELSETAFRGLAARVCRDESRAGDRVRSVTLQSRRVAYGEFRGDIVWDPPVVLESFPCP